MATRRITTLAVGMAAFAWMPIGIALAGGPDDPIPQDREARLLEKFGDKGIDADADGQLTRKEVRDFFDAFKPRRGEGKERQKGHHGRRGRGEDKHGPRHAGRILRRIEKLDSDSPPADCNPDWIAKADADGNGTVSDSEWAAFAGHARQELLTELVALVPEVDVDKNGKIDDAELELFKDKHMDRMRSRILSRNPEADTDGDGTLSDDEFEAFRAAHPGPRHRPGRRHHD